MGHYEVENNVSKARETRSGRYRDIVQSAVSNRLLISYIIFLHLDESLSLTHHLKFSQADETVLESQTAGIEERQVLYCITTPALNDWVYEVLSYY